MRTPASVPDPVLRLTAVEVRRGARPTLAVPSFAVAPGEIVALTGPNGAGKSTLLHVAGLLLRPEAGEVAIGGERATKRSAAVLRRRIAMVFQDPLLFDVSVLENAASGLRFHGMKRRAAEDRARAWLARFGVAALAERRARSLSGGEAQRVALARAFAVEPALLLLDEPFAALDAPTRASLLPDLMAGLQATGAAAVLVTHDLAEAVALGDRLGVLVDGALRRIGPSDEVLASPGSEEVGRFLHLADRPLAGRSDAFRQPGDRASALG